MSYFVKRTNGAVSGIARAPQVGWPVEELPDNHPDVLTYLANIPPVLSDEEKEADAQAALAGGAVRIDLQKMFKAKVISDEAYRLGKAPGALTGAELTAIRNRIAAIYKAL